MDRCQFKATINGQQVVVEISPALRLSELLRDVLGLTGTKEGCGEGECGACTIVLDGKIVNSCLLMAMQAYGKEIISIEGLNPDGELHPVQQAFLKHGAVQCGYCTPGMVLAGKVLLDGNPKPSRKEIAVAMSGNVCRCTGYAKIIDAIDDAAMQIKGSTSGEKS